IVEGKTLELDLEKIREEEKYDGYYSIVTSELGMSDEEIRKVYSGLAKIEASFKVTWKDRLPTCLLLTSPGDGADYIHTGIDAQ
ncbi:MAG: hypothetical protein IJT24_02760, partial [Lachnospiraceae bacterium]|nr:hypothetical protein [Lachnospiraceae bacterium]